MKTDYDALVQASRLVDELGEAAVRISRVRLVELTAANQVRAAAFWRQVMLASEDLLASRGNGGPGNGGSGSGSGVNGGAVKLPAARQYHR